MSFASGALPLSVIRRARAKEGEEPWSVQSRCIWERVVHGRKFMGNLIDMCDARRANKSERRSAALDTGESRDPDMNLNDPATCTYL